MYDGLGSVVAEVKGDGTGTVTSSRKYDVFGSVRGGSNPSGTSKQKFVGGLGHVSDDETGYVYMQARYMDPNTGRFVSEDLIGSGTNWYAYASNNPINRLDPDGELDGAAAGLELEANYGKAVVVAGFGALEAVLKTIAIIYGIQVLLASDSYVAQITADELISAQKKAGIRRVFPGQMLGEEIEQIEKLAKDGNRAAQTALKLLKRREYDKDQGEGGDHR